MPQARWTSTEEYVRPLPDRLWTSRVPRSSELTALYAQRYVGPRTSTQQTVHSFAEITCCISGKGTMLTDSRIGMRAHRAVFIASNVPHQEHASSNLETIWIGLRGSMTEALSQESVLIADAASITHYAERLWEAGQSESQGAGAECDALARLVFARLIESGETGVHQDIVHRALSLMHERLGESLTVAQLAAALDCSEGHLHRAFRARTGQTPIQRLTRLRMDRALHLIQHTRLSMKQIAHRLGYDDPLYFSRVFRKHYCQSPREIAKRLRD